jgi:hypothetical protein
MRFAVPVPKALFSTKSKKVDGVPLVVPVSANTNSLMSESDTATRSAEIPARLK